MTGGDGVNADLARYQFERQRPGQRFNGTFVETYSRAPITGCEPRIELRLMMLPPSVPNRLIASWTARIAPRTLLL